MFNASNYSIDSIFNDIQVGFGKNSWYIKKPLTECRNLFEGEEITYQVQAFLCKCGEQYIYITQKNKKRILHRCSNCNNNHFFDVICYSNKYNDLLVNIDHEAILSMNNTYAYAKLYVNTPIHIDLSANKIIFQKQLVYTLRICLNGGEERHQEKHILTSDVTGNTYNKLLSYIDKHYLSQKLKDYDKLYMHQKTSPQFRKAVTFFLKYHYFYDSSFLLWQMDDDLYHDGGIEKTLEKFLTYIRNNRTEKSIKKTLYSRYLYEIEVGKFNPFIPYVICRIFNDPNLVCKLLNNYELVLTYRTSNSMKTLATSHIRLLEFLLNQYSEKVSVNILEKLNGDPTFWEDSVSMFDNILELELTSRHFQKPRANIKAIHDELIRARQYSKYSVEKVSFTYTDAIQNACGLWHGLYITLPKNSGELIQWSQLLKNCLYGYVSYVFAQETTIFGIKKGKELLYAIEIEHGTIKQMHGKHNSKIEGTDSSSLVAWYRHYFSDNILSPQQTLENHEG